MHVRDGQIYAIKKVFDLYIPGGTGVNTLMGPDL
jgi:hypothetical protein